ncbi:hypothetical protein VNO77_03132 [Canavalia gladiata]|uniref:Uncharacterized protein n=1 Tax=Canavalia gladiata TaxID=3824 RepID=A0AAN9R3K3_CANGL
MVCCGKTRTQVVRCESSHVDKRSELDPLICDPIPNGLRIKSKATISCHACLLFVGYECEPEFAWLLYGFPWAFLTLSQTSGDLYDSPQQEDQLGLENLSNRVYLELRIVEQILNSNQEQRCK